MTVLITLTLAGSDTGPFNIYSNADGFITPTEIGVSKAALIAGYDATVPDGTTEVLVQSTGVCERDLYLMVAGAPTTTTTTSSTTSTTSSTTTLNPDELYLAQIGRYAKEDGCPAASILRVFLDASDYALFVANGNSFAGLGGGASTTCTAIARNSIGNPITGLLYDEDNITWDLTSGSFDYYSLQC
tara:strand:+ start:232 stop:792 length:561 start_codon:yes stop_codon:yes gene_type:complete